MPILALLALGAAWGADIAIALLLVGQRDPSILVCCAGGVGAWVILLALSAPREEGWRVARSGFTVAVAVGLVLLLIAGLL